MAQGATAFLFPGQGRVPDGPPPDSALSRRLRARAEANGVPLREAQAGHGDLLQRSSLAQPAILVDELCKDEALRQAGVRPALVAGHSLGEFAALVSAGVLTPEEGIDLVLVRARLMEDVPGSMAAVLRLPLSTIEQICSEVGPSVVVANENGPTQVVISGTVPAVCEAVRRAEEAGGRVIRLNVPGPFHSPLMASAQEGLAQAIGALVFRAPSVPIVSAVSGQPERDPDRLQALLLTQMTSRVRFGEVLLRLREASIARAIEVGPGDALCGIGRRAVADVQFQTFEEALGGGE